MLLKESDSEVSTEKEEAEKETARQSISTFLPCSFKVLLLITISTLLGYWIIRGISPGGITGQRALLFGSQPPLDQAETYTAVAAAVGKMKKAVLITYRELSKIVEECEMCCV